MIANLIKKSLALSAEVQLKFQSKKAALPLLKLLKSAVASAVNNFNLSPENLFISNVLVDEGQKLKRFRPRAFGRAGAIHKKTSHITLILEERTTLGVKKQKKKSAMKTMPEEIKEIAIEKEKISKLPKIEAVKEIKPKQGLRGITRKIFRRKAIG